ncbi:hypothetical protein SIN8267_02655 [Sinobacterium norvegicum]|uniref:Biopolymer transporter ExbD n=1 Tax=Sinobacterium norvegicum TaxID=1641715 RepID=A0ABM9AH28_9GAMM|nr:biopolymer transporter ExbD [Sinobacterium norvegicum]CAH0992523.1 hypothetical protein SIN8267_02655 [Sinobacterium norvegicum]
MALVNARKKKSFFDTKLNLVSLMDIFTILVFFLLLNSGESEELEQAKFITLPDSSAKGDVKADIMIVVSGDQILFDGKPLLYLADLDVSKNNTIELLQQALVEHRSVLQAEAELELDPELLAEKQQAGFNATILGDQTVPYHLLKTIMTTCNAAEFRNISLAVNQVTGPILASGQVASIGE